MMATFSPYSAEYLPPQWRSLTADANSPILDYYPKNFRVDPNSKKKSSQYLPLVPLIDENRLRQALKSVSSTLTLEEEQRNRLDSACLFLRSQNVDEQKFKQSFDNNEKNSIPVQEILKEEKFIGYVWHDDNDRTIDNDLKT